MLIEFDVLKMLLTCIKVEMIIVCVVLKYVLCGRRMVDRVGSVLLSAARG